MLGTIGDFIPCTASGFLPGSTIGCAALKLTGDEDEEEDEGTGGGGDGVFELILLDFP